MNTKTLLIIGAIVVVYFMYTKTEEKKTALAPVQNQVGQGIALVNQALGAVSQLWS